MGKKKKKGRSSSINVKYNRPSKGFQMNYARSGYKAVGLDVAHRKDSKKILKRLKASYIVWLILTVVLVFRFKLSGMLDALVLGVALTGGWLIYVNRVDTKIIISYLKLDVPEEEYLKELAARGVPEKRLAKIDKMWKKAEKKGAKKA